MNEKATIKYLSKILGDYDLQGSSNILFKCPFCENYDKEKKKLTINYKTGKYRCWICGIGGVSLKTLFQKLGHPDFFNDLKKENPYSDIDEAIKDLKFGNKETIKSVELPKEYELIYPNQYVNYFQPAIKFLLNKRKIAFSDILKYKIHYDVTNRKIMFPSYDENLKINFYVERFIDYGRYNMPEYPKSKIIFNEFMIDWEQKVYIVEGVFDAIRSGKNAVPLLGSYMDNTSKLFSKLLKYKSKVVLAFDPDAKLKQNKIANLFYNNGIEVECIDWQKCNVDASDKIDIGDIGEEGFNEVLKTSDEFSFEEYILEELKK